MWYMMSRCTRRWEEHMRRCSRFSRPSFAGRQCVARAQNSEVANLPTVTTGHKNTTRGGHGNSQAERFNT